MKSMTTKLLATTFLSLVVLSQSACLRTRGMIREGQTFDVDPGSNSSQGQRNPQADAYLVDELKAEIARLTGRIEELERAKAEAARTATDPNPQLKAYEQRMSELEKTQLAILETIKGQKPSPQTAAASSAAGTEAQGQNGLEKGKALFQAGKFEPAIEALTQFISQPAKLKSSSMEEALQLLGESHFLLKQYQAAIVEYSKIQEKLPKSKRVPGALLRIAQSFEAMGFSEDAKGFYQELTDRFPKSTEARKAQESLGKKGEKKTSKSKGGSKAGA